MDTPDTPARPPLLGLVGFAGAGKDTVAEYLQPYGWARVAFADALKEAALDVDPILGARPLAPVSEGPMRLSDLLQHRDGWDHAKEVPEARRLLQNLGVAVRRLDPDFWVRTAMARADQVDGPVVVTDVRFPNEVEAIRERGGKVIHLTNPRVGRRYDHESEELAAKWERCPNLPDGHLANSGSLNHMHGLIGAVEPILRRLASRDR